MGTNYYAVHEESSPCRHCAGTGKETVQIHIGKSSQGWTFTFSAPSALEMESTGVATPIDSYQGWLAYLSDPKVKIVDEYAELMTVEEFMELVRAKKSERNNHTDCVQSDPSYLNTRFYNGTFKDAEGNSFVQGEFS